MKLQNDGILTVYGECTIDSRRGGDHDRLSVRISIGRVGSSTAASTTRRVLPPATRLVRTVHGRDANSLSSPEIGKGDPSKCCTGVQTSAMPVVRRPLKSRAHDPRTWHNAPCPLTGPPRI